MVDGMDAISDDTLTCGSEGGLKADLVPSLPKSYIAVHPRQFAEQELLISLRMD